MANKVIFDFIMVIFNGFNLFIKTNDIFLLNFHIYMRGNTIKSGQH